MDDAYFMRQALLLAEEAAGQGEVPVGAVVVRDDEMSASERTGAKRTKPPFPMPKRTRSTMRAVGSAAGDCGTARCM